MKESHAYNKGKALVVSKVPLPDYRADLDERHGSTQKEVKTSFFFHPRLYGIGRKQQNYHHIGSRRSQKVNYWS